VAHDILSRGAGGAEKTDDQATWSRRLAEVGRPLANAGTSQGAASPDDLQINTTNRRETEVAGAAFSVKEE